jgi:D-arabinose 5-phosphate isomerase GutQ
MATVFEQSLLLVFDLIVLELMKKMAKTSETMLRRHANLE